MKKRIVICADGTWNRPEKNLSKDFPTNVLKIARAIQPHGSGGMDQQVFYDWGVGSYYDSVSGGITGKGIQKNIMDDYRYIVQNYSPDDELYFIGFSRGAYTVRSLCGLINNCGILKRPDAKLIEQAFQLYKNPGRDYKPQGKKSIEFRNKYSYHPVKIKFVGVWDTVGALGIPFSFLGFLEKKDEFYDNKMGPNIEVARHALSIDELRSDFEPTIWKQKNVPGDLKQVWFTGVHSDIGGSYPPDKDGSSLADIPLKWMIDEMTSVGLTIEDHLIQSLQPNRLATLHQSRKHIYRSKKPYYRPINHNEGKVIIHQSVKERWEAMSNYRPKNLTEYVQKFGWPELE